MNFFASRIVGFALLLLVLLPNTTKAAEQARMIELQFSVASSTFGELPATVQVREGEASMLTLHRPDEGYFQYTVHAQQASADSLPALAKKISAPLMVSIRVDTSTDGKTWMLQTQARVLAWLGGVVSVELSDTEKSTSLFLSARLLGNEGRGKKK